jgi:mannose-6-phosphate isomerase-like protein (cupin superfamily)
MDETTDSLEQKGGVAHVVGPDQGQGWWQPVPANGFAEVRVGPRNVPGIGFSSGVQHVAPGGHVREHLHPAQEELLFFFEGEGIAVIDGVEHRLVPGTTVYLGPYRRHKFVNTGEGELKFFWFLMPGGLEDFFQQIGRDRTPGEAAPAPFPRPTDVIEIEKKTVFDHWQGAPDVEPKS